VYIKHSRALEMRACRLAVIEALETVGATLPVPVISEIAARACEGAAEGTDRLASVGVVDSDCEEITHCIVCRDPDNRGCCEYGRAA
jgi:dUTPase